MALGESKGGGNASAVKAGEAFFEVNVDDKGVLPALKRFTNKFASVGAGLRQAGLTAASAGALALTPMLALMGAAVDRADKMQDIAERFGETTEAISALSFAAERAGMTFEELQDGFKKLDELVKRGLDGDGKALAALNQMGTSAREFSELDLTQKLTTIADAFEGMTDPLQRSKFLFDTFGENARKFLPLIEQGSAGLREQFQRAADVGDVVTSEQGRAAAKMKDAWDDTLKSIKNTLLSVGYAMFGFSDSVEGGSQSIVQLLKHVREWVAENAGLIRLLAQVATGMLAVGAASFALGKGIALIGPAITLMKTVAVTAFAVVKGAILAALSPIGLIVTGVAALGAGIATILLTTTETGAEIRKRMGEAFTDVGAIAKETWGGIVDFIKKGDLESAFEIAGAGISAAWHRIILGLMRAWRDFGKDIIDGPLGQLNELLSPGMNDKIRTIMDFKILEREKQLQKALEELRRLRAKAAAKPPEPGKREKEPWEKEPWERYPRRVLELGQSVRGTFGSADYRGSLGIGKANEYAKKANEELKKIKEELQKLNKKPGVAWT